MNCKLPNANQYILPATIRNYHLICGLVTSAGLLAFSAFMYGVAYMQHSSTVPCLVVGIIFTAFSVVYMVIWCSKYNLINAKFYADGYIVLNQVGSKDGGRFSVLAAKDRNRYIHKLHDKGLSIRQISRLTGISKKIVERNI